MTHIQALIYIIVFIAFVLLSWTSLKIIVVLVNLLAAAISKESFSMRINKTALIFSISLAIVLAYLLF